MNEETKDTRIAELERQATMDGGLARLALNAAKDQLASAEAALDKAQAINVELRAQLQAAPAERGFDSMLRKKAPQPPTLTRCGTGALYGEQTYCFEKGWRQGIAAYRKMLRRLNPAPATADSDAREVKN